MLKKIIPDSFKKKIKNKLGVPDTFDSFKRLKALGFNPKSIIDVGAYEGYWTEEMIQLFPEANFFMAEAQSSKEAYLKKTIARHPGKVSYSISLLGAKDGDKVIFNEYETASSVLAEHFETNAAKSEKTIQTLDNLLSLHKIAPPEFIKLDTQGYELEVLKGSSKALTTATIVLMEVSFIDIYVNVPLVKSSIDFMEERGFVVYDIGSIIRRPLDKALYQADLIFARKDSSFRVNKKWK
jgi:FkbM family methyltransferase